METKKYIGEIWKDIKGYDGLYQISNFGRVKSLEKNKRSHHNYTYILKKRILTPFFSSYGYCVVNLYKLGKCKQVKVHRLVAEAFIPNPKHLTEVNHKDEDKTNNRLSNLEWCTRKYNCNYGTRIKRIVLKKTSPNN